MSDNQTQQEDRTEQATSKRLDDARRKGQIPRSRELNMAVVLIAACVALYSDGDGIAASARDLMTHALRFDREALADPGYMTTALGDAVFTALRMCTPLFAALAAAAVLGAVAIGGFVFSTEPVSFKFERIDPIAGMGRMFSMNSLVEVLKALAKAAVIIGFTVALLMSSTDSLLGLSARPINSAMAEATWLPLLALAVSSAALLLIAAVDAPWQLWSYAQRMKMSRKEIEDEAKESDGRPEVRSRIRALQQETAKRRMLADVAKADVVITNPTHFAVALRYDDQRMRAPVVLAKGADLTAARIREVATGHKIALFESPLLARALYWSTDIGQEIPAPLYLAVAQVLTYIYRLRNARTLGGAWPEKPAIEVDPELASGPQQKRRRRR
jgi:flagellar biosynthetic protein FlhB